MIGSSRCTVDVQLLFDVQLVDVSEVVGRLAQQDSERSELACDPQCAAGSAASWAVLFIRLGPRAAVRAVTSLRRRPPGGAGSATLSFKGGSSIPSLLSSSSSLSSNSFLTSHRGVKVCRFVVGCSRRQAVDGWQPEVVAASHLKGRAGCSNRLSTHRRGRS